MRNWLSDFGRRTLRTKPRYLGRGAARPTGARGGWGGACCAAAAGLLLLLLRDEDTATALLLAPLAVAGALSLLGGLCLTEYISLQPQEVPSVYSCCYQYSSEVLAFFVGWSWLLSQAAMVAAICTSTSAHVETSFKELSGLPYLELALPLALLAAVSFVVLTGVCQSAVWHVITMPVALLAVLAAVVVKKAALEEFFQVFEGKWMEIKNVSQLLTTSSLCLLFFTGPQSLLRISAPDASPRTRATLGPLNALLFVLLLLLLPARSSSRAPPPQALLASCTLVLASLLLLGTELVYVLNAVAEAMATDGLLFRGLAKPWTPFCGTIPGPWLQGLSAAAVALLLLLQTFLQLMRLSVVFPLVVHSVVPVLVLMRRYRDMTSWQFEPVRQTSAVRRGSGKGDESTACVTDSDSDTDIDSVVRQYRDHARVASMAPLEELHPSDQLPEPSPSSWFRAKLCIGALVCTSISCAGVLQFASILPALGLTLLSTALQGLLVLLPQNSGTKCRLPWMPGFSSLVASSLLLHCLLDVWKVFLGWLLLGILIYLLYGIHSSTAANSFHNLQTMHIALRPLPSYGNNCVPLVLPSHRKTRNSLSVA